MPDTTQTRPETGDELEAFTVLALRCLDGGCSTEEIKKLKNGLADGALSRQRFIDLCRMHGEMQEVYGPRRSALLGKGAGAAGTAAVVADEGARPAAEGEYLPPANLPQEDPCADTVMRDLSPEDTAHPAPKPTE